MGSTFHRKWVLSLGCFLYAVSGLTAQDKGPPPPQAGGFGLPDLGERIRRLPVVESAAQRELRRLQYEQQLQQYNLLKVGREHYCPQHSCGRLGRKANP